MSKQTLAQSAATLSAAEVLETYCPMGDAVDGVVAEQDWDNETTTLTFSDGSAVVISGSAVVEVAS